jgi:molybdenum cofactor cytidylyltransferase
MASIAGIILAAGASTRMGTDKALLRWGVKTFLEHLLAVLRAAGAEPLRVVAGANAAVLGQAVPLAPGELVVNEKWEQGQLSSLLAGLDSLPRESEAALVCLVDHPCVSSALLRSLMEQFRATRRTIVLPTFRGRRGHPTLFAASLFDALRAAPLEAGARYVVYQRAADVLEVPTEEEGILLNTNDPAAYERLLRMAPPE